MIENSNNNEKSSWGLVQYIGAMVAAFPFHFLFVFSIQLNGLFSWKTGLYGIINLVLLSAMFLFIKYIYKETDTKAIIKKILCFEILPVVLLFFFLLKGKSIKISRFGTNQEYLNNVKEP